MRLAELRQHDESLLFKIFTIDDQALTRLIISMVYQKIEKNIESFSLYREVNPITLYKPEIAHKLNDYFHLKQKQPDAKSGNALALLEAEKVRSQEANEAPPSYTHTYVP